MGMKSMYDLRDMLCKELDEISRTDATEHLRSQINDMMRETDDDRIKDALRRAMDMMEE